ncbi:DUF6435 family protein [Pseudoalteromonas sp. OOF1S-7]|nr:DUF6435 family protein [Pseudoalteromonas sp. OOF1S-7]MCG7535986.1 DUF6435 family protein [Pseudoalteromonas sp. OOF1S-7]
MFQFLRRDPVKKLRNAYNTKLAQATHAQRNGDIRGYAMLTAEAEPL